VSEVKLLRADAVEPRATRWLWAGRIPLGAVTVFVGKPGLGKTTAEVELVAQLTTGRLQGEFILDPVACLVATAEDAVESTLVPRLIAAQADLKLVHFVTAETNGEATMLTLPDDIPTLAWEAEQVGARFLVVDPLVAFLPDKVNAWRDQDVRRALAPLARMAEQQNLAVMVTVHLRKEKADDVLGQIGGSVGLGAAARSVLLLASDPDAPDTPARVLAHAKCNVGPLTSSLGCQIEAASVPVSDGVIETSRLRFTGRREGIGAEDLLAVTERVAPRARDEAADFIRQELAAGPVPAAEMTTRAAALGIAEKTLKRAKQEVGVRSGKGKGSQTGAWYWELPPEGGAPAIAPTLDPLDLVDPLLGHDKEAKGAKEVKGGVPTGEATLSPDAFIAAAVEQLDAVELTAEQAAAYESAETLDFTGGTT
jgi:hypothetical protein